VGDLRVGVVGLGWAAGAHLQAFRGVTGARVTAVCSRRNPDPAELKKKHDLSPKVYSDYGALLADPEVDVVDICTPHPFHAEQAIAAARAGKHLILEKPIALRFEEAKAVREAIRRAGVRACVCFEGRFSDPMTMARSVIDQGLLGELHYGEVDYFHGIGPWYGQFEWNVKKEWGGSSLLTAGCHAMDKLLFFMDAPVEEVTGVATKSRSEIFAPYEYPTTTVALLKFKGGKVGKVASVIDCLQPYTYRVHLVGSAGSLLDNRFHSAKIKGLSKDRWSTLETRLLESGDVRDHPYRPQFQAFVDSTRRGEDMPLTDFETAFEVHRVVFAADRSARLGRPVKLSEEAS